MHDDNLYIYISKVAEHILEKRFLFPISRTVSIQLNGLNQVSSLRSVSGTSFHEACKCYDYAEQVDKDTQ